MNICYILLKKGEYMQKTEIEWGLATLELYSKSTIEKELGHLKLNKIQILFILHLKMTNGIRQDLLLKVFKLKRYTITRSINKMIKLGYIDKRTDDYNKTANFIYLTPKGHEIFAEIHNVLKQWLEIITKGFTDEEIKTSINLLLRMAKNASFAYKDNFLFEQLSRRIQSLAREQN